MCKDIQHRLGNNVRIPIKLIHSFAMNGWWSFRKQDPFQAGKGSFLKRNN